MAPPYSRTDDGFELQFGTNHLGQFALTGRLLGMLMGTAGSRVVNVSSLAHRFGNLDFGDLGWQTRKYNPGRAYGDSKLANLLFTYELQRRLKSSGSKTLSIAAHPGWSATNLQRHSRLLGFMNHLFAQNAIMGSLPTLRAATEPGLRGGEFIGPDGFMGLRGHPEILESSERSHKREDAKKLWEIFEKMTGVRYSFS